MAGSIEAALEKLVDQDGPWTAHSIHLGDGIYTFAPWLDTRIKRILQNVADVLGGSLQQRRVLDLAALEGQLGIEFALHGADVVAIEGRETNIRKAKFAREALRLTNLELVRGDVRTLGKEKHGLFDVVLCAGILYHLDANDACELVASIASVCERVAIIDTHVSLSETDCITWRDRQYWGKFVEEHPAGATDEQVSASLWHSLDNRSSFNFTRDSLCNLLRHLGFTSVFESLVPYEAYHADWPRDSGPIVEFADRVTLVAIKGGQQKVLSSPDCDERAQIDRLERSQVDDPPGLLQRFGRRADQAIRRIARRRPEKRWANLLSGQDRPGGGN